MTDPVQETENVPESAHTLASIAQILNENPESGLEIVRAAFDAERERALTALRERAKDFESLKTVRLGFFGDKGSMSLANKQMRDLQNQHKGPVGKLLGQARAALTEAIEARTAELEAEREARILEEEAVDVTAASARRSLGGRHPALRGGHARRPQPHPGALSRHGAAGRGAGRRGEARQEEGDKGDADNRFHGGNSCLRGCYEQFILPFL